MNTIPTTFDEHQINLSELGGRVENQKAALNMSVILLNTNGSYFKDSLLETLLNCNFRSIIAVEINSKNHSVEDLSRKYPSIRFIVPLEETTDGELINLAMAEIQADYVMVLRNNLLLTPNFIQPLLQERVVKDDVFCIVPRLTDHNKSSMICQFSPAAIKNKFVVEASSVVADGMNTLYPFENIAIYNREKFIKLGGFDYSIKSKYWQTLDLGIRSWLWGEKTKLTTLLQFSYLEEPPLEDQTINIHYLRYFLKNEIPKIKNDMAVISSTSFMSFFLHSSCGYLEARRQFKAARIWVGQNRLKFQKDLQKLIKEWKI